MKNAHKSIESFGAVYVTLYIPTSKIESYHLNGIPINIFVSFFDLCSRSNCIALKSEEKKIK